MVGVGGAVGVKGGRRLTSVESVEGSEVRGWEHKYDYVEYQTRSFRGFEFVSSHFPADGMSLT